MAAKRVSRKIEEKLEPENVGKKCVMICPDPRMFGHNMDGEDRTGG